MAYGGDPANSNNDAVRALLGDTSSTALLSDNEVAWLVASHPNVYYAASVGADMLFAKNAEAVVSKKVGDLSLLKGDASGGVARNYKTLGEQLRLTAARMGVKGFAGGISVSDKDTQVGDSDWDNPGIGLGMHDYDTANSTSGVMSF